MLLPQEERRAVGRLWDRNARSIAYTTAFAGVWMKRRNGQKLEHFGAPLRSLGQRNLASGDRYSVLLQMKSNTVDLSDQSHSNIALSHKDRVICVRPTLQVV